MTPTIGSQTSLMEAGILQALEAGRLGKIEFHDAPGMRAFYQARAFKPAWVKSSFLNEAKAATLLKFFEDSWQHGLNPNNYHVSVIRQLMDQAQGVDQFELELVLSDALVRYGRHMTGMRVNPRDIGQRSKYWRQPLLGIDVLEHVAGSTDTSRALKILAPQGNLYKRLQEELVNLYKTPPESNRQSRIYLKGVIRPGQTHATVRVVRRRLGLSDADAVQGANYYDDRMAQAVMSFQRAHGLKPDAIIGSHTIKLINMTRDDRINQVLANLERLRWVEPQKPDRYVMVNVPSATLWAVDDGDVKLEMPVVVGRKKRPTNIFSTTITGIRFNPTWTVPPTIKKDDYLPELRKDPYYLSDRGIELYQGGSTIDPGMIDWDSISWSEVNAMRMVQNPGSSNPLGRVRVIMNNPFNIYLHDTPTKSYFKRADRALSSGCIRMAEPEKFADFVLSPNANWSMDKMQSIFDRGKLTEIRAEQPLPVYILYQTVWLGNGGQIVYGSDLYDHDYQLVQALRKINGVAIQETEVARTAKKE